MRNVTILAIIGTIIFILWAMISRMGMSVLEDGFTGKVIVTGWSLVSFIQYGTLLAFFVTFLTAHENNKIRIDDA